MELRKENWNTIAEELDKVGINIDDEVISEMVDGQQEPIDKIFMRIERYMKIIAGAEFLKFDNLLPEDLQNIEGEDEEVLLPQITEMDISDLIDLRQNTINLSASRGKKNGAFMPPGLSLPDQADEETVDLDGELLESSKP